EGEHDPAPARQLVDGLEPGGCRKAQGGRGSVSRRPIESVGHLHEHPHGKAARGGRMTRRIAAGPRLARAIWYAGKGVVELRAAPLAPLRPGEARVRTLFSGISRGTERLVFHGAVGETEWERMRAPSQEGDFPFPVKYGYCATGVVEAGPKELSGRTVFCLHPHQDYFNAPAASLVPVPEAVPARRAT